MYAGKVKPVRSGGTITVELLHSSMGIGEGNLGYQIR